MWTIADYDEMLRKVNDPEVSDDESFALVLQAFEQFCHHAEIRYWFTLGVTLLNALVPKLTPENCLGCPLFN
jgi:hypothetical protein